MANEIKFGNSEIIKGISKVSSVVKETFGPKGHCVAIESSFGAPDITRDGATVAKAITLKNKVENMGAELVKKAAQSTEDQAGDGTSSTCILINEIIQQASTRINSKTNLNEVKDGMNKVCGEITEFIKNMATPVKDDIEKIRKVATISANNDPTVGNLIVECMEKVGMNGVITADLSKTLETKVEVTSGFKIDRGWASPNFITNPKDGKSTMEEPAIAVFGEKLSSIPQIQPIIQSFAQNCPGREIVIFCDDIDDSVLTFFLFNHLNGALKSCIIKGVDFGDNRKNIMEDIATYTGATYVCSEFGLEVSKCGVEVLGSAKKVVTSKDSCIIYEGQGDPDNIEQRLEILKERAADPDVSRYEKDKFEHRVASLSGGIGIIKAGGASETEQINKKATIEDAILASKSAIEEGVVPGSGYVFLKASKEISKKTDKNPDIELGRRIVLDSLGIITETIAENAGECGKVILNTINNSKKENFGYNAKTGEFGNLLDMGVLDSAKVLRVSLENAISAASMTLLTSSTITTVEEKDCCCCK